VSDTPRISEEESQMKCRCGHTSSAHEAYFEGMGECKDCSCASFHWDGDVPSARPMAGIDKTVKQAEMIDAKVRQRYIGQIQELTERAERAEARITEVEQERDAAHAHACEASLEERALRAASETLQTALRWQPIETYTKTDEVYAPVLVADVDGYVVEANYSVEHGVWWELNSEDDGAPGNDRRVQPTHWMPLPSPPALLVSGQAPGPPQTIPERTTNEW
jgi:hypothetical protein